MRWQVDVVTMADGEYRERRSVTHTALIAVAAAVLSSVSCGESGEACNGSAVANQDSEYSRLIHVAGNEWVKVVRSGGGTELFWQKREAKGGGIHVCVEPVEPVLRVSGNPEVTVDDEAVVVLAWPDGTEERHEYRVLRERSFELSLDELEREIHELINSEEKLDEVVRRLGLEKREEGEQGAY